MKFTYSIPTKILFGPGSFNDLATTPLPGKKALVVITAGKSMRANGYLDRLIDMLDKQGIGHALFDKSCPTRCSAMSMKARRWPASRAATS